MIDIWAKLDKDFDNAPFRADDPVKNEVECIPFPSPALGDVAHIWGWPLGRVSQIHGLPGSGKTFLAMLSVKEAQMKYPDSTCVWVDTEYQFNPKWAADIGVDTTRLRVIQDNDAAGVFSKLFGRVNDKGTKNKLGVVDYIREGHLDCKLIVLDSIANLVPPVEIGRNFEDQNMAALARFLPGAFNRASRDLSQTNTALLCINQARVDMSSRMGGITYPGGFKYKHNLSLAIRVNASMAKEATIFDSKGRKLGHKILATVEKTRFGPDKYKTAFMVNFFEGVVQQGESIAMMGDAYGIVNRPNNTKWIYGEHEFVGKDKFFSFLDENPEVRAEIITAIKEAKGRGVVRGLLLDETAEIDMHEDVYAEER